MISGSSARRGCGGSAGVFGGDATATTKERAHVAPRNPQFWRGSANPVRSYTLLNNESPDFIRFVNPGDFRIAHISCGTVGCHPKELQTNRKQIMTTGCMLWGATAYNNGTLPVKRAVLGEAYGMYGAPLRLYAGVKLGYKMVKYLTEVNFRNEPSGGYWEDQGYEWFAGV